MSEFRDESSRRRSDEISLQPILQTLWSYRRVTLFALVAAVVAYAAVMLFVYARTPKETVASIEFLLMFEGADRGKNPNGTRFSPSEIVSTPVLTAVFAKNELERYMPFQGFKDSMFILEANPDLELLSHEYRSKLADTRLSAVDRGRIEEEFRRKRESLRSAAFSLHFRMGHAFLRLPPDLLSKILIDTLSVWAQQAGERKGILRYDIPIVSKAALRQEMLQARHDVVAVDILRNALDRLRGSIAQIGRLPGAAAARIDKNTLGLADIKARVDDVLNFNLEPLLSATAAADSSQAERYFADRALSVRVMREQAQTRLTALQDALRAYQQRGSAQAGTTVLEGGSSERVTPQLTESFIDRLVQLSTQSEDLEYRQTLTDRIIDVGVEVADLTRQEGYYAALLKTPARGGGLPPAEIERRRQEAYNDAVRLMEQLDRLYAQVTEQNLNPTATLYTLVSTQAVRTTSALDGQTVVLYFFVTLFAAAIVVPLACLAHDYARNKIVAPPAHPPSAAGSGSHHVAGV